jgi:hypothetical protein
MSVCWLKCAGRGIVSGQLQIQLDDLRNCDLRRSCYAIEGESLQAQPTQRKKTTRTLFPLPNWSFLSRVRGARSPILGHSPIWIGGGTGVSQAWAVRGRLFIDIQAGHWEFLSSRSSRPGIDPSGFFCSFLGFSAGGDEKSKVLLDNPTFLRAIFVVRLENMFDMAVAQEDPGLFW